MEKAKIEEKTKKVKIEARKMGKNTPIELDVEKPTSNISTQKDTTLGLVSLEPKELDVLYYTVPEVTRTVDLRGAASIYRGYEILPRDDSKEATEYAQICSAILNLSGGVTFIEQWQKNADLYGDGYVELSEEGGKVTELVHVHPQNFGYELETVFDEVNFSYTSKVKLDPNTQKPVGYATYVFDEDKQVLVNDKVIELDNIAHLKYKVIGDAIYGSSIVSPMRTSIERKLKLEQAMEDAGRMVAVPKIVIQGEFPTEEDARQEAKEAASLDSSDVVIIQNGEKFEIVNPGSTSLPELREIFVTNISCASGIPRPILTSEKQDMSKEAMVALMRTLRQGMRANMNAMKNTFENGIFARIGKSYNIPDWQLIIPIFVFPEDIDTEQDMIIREERKANTLTSLSNNLQILTNSLSALQGQKQIGNEDLTSGKAGRPKTDGSNSVPELAEGDKEEVKDSVDIQAKLKGLIGKVIDLFEKTADTFMVNNDQDPNKIEEVRAKDSLAPIINLDTYDPLMDGEGLVNPSAYSGTLDQQTADSVDVESSLTNVTIIDEIEDTKNEAYLNERHELMHRIYGSLLKGAEVWDYVTGSLITIPKVMKKHQFYVEQLQTMGLIHDIHVEIPELDETLYNG